VEPIANNMDPKRVRIGTSFHPQFSELEFFIKKINFLRDNGFETWVNFVPWPPFFPQIENFKNMLQQNKRVHLLGVIFPYLKPLNEYSNSEMVSYNSMKKALKDLNIDYIDLHIYFPEQERYKYIKKDKRGEFIKMGEKPDYCHPTKEGYFIAAKAIYNYLIERYFEK